MFGRRSTGDFSAEIQSHIDMETDRLRAQGMSASDARASALRERNSDPGEFKFSVTRPRRC